MESNTKKRGPHRTNTNIQKEEANVYQIAKEKKRCEGGRQEA